MFAQAVAQAELENHLVFQGRAAAAQVDRIDSAEATYLSIIDKDRPATRQNMIRLMVLLENQLEEEKLVDVVTNNDRFSFLAAVLKRHFPQWRISESWEGKEPF
jgi:hypothetical protein